MNQPKNRFLEQDYRGGSQDYARGMKDYAKGGQDYRDYEQQRREQDQRERDYAMQGNQYQDHRQPYEMYGYARPMQQHIPPYDMRDYREDYRGGDMRDYHSEKKHTMQEYRQDLHEWTEKMKSKARIKVPKEQIITQARNMGIKFDKFSEDEFYAIYLANVTDHPSVTNDYNVYIKLTKDFFDDDDIAVTPSEHVYIKLYKIVKGE